MSGYMALSWDAGIKVVLCLVIETLVEISHSKKVGYICGTCLMEEDTSI